jgi:hypothetical protein
MTSSQKYSSIAFIATLISTVGAAVLPQLTEYKGITRIVSISIAAAGAIVMLFNQSVSPNHKSVPTKKAEKLIRDDPEAAKKLGLVKELPSLDETTHTRSKRRK